MKELYRTNNLVQLSWLQALLADGGVEAILLDDHTSTAYGAALMERRLMVLDEDLPQAQRIMAEARKQDPDLKK